MSSTSSSNKKQIQVDGPIPTKKSTVFYDFMIISEETSTHNCLTSAVKYRNSLFPHNSNSTTALFLDWFCLKSKYWPKIVKSLLCLIGCSFQVLRIFRKTLQLRNCVFYWLSSQVSLLSNNF